MNKKVLLALPICVSFTACAMQSGDQSMIAAPAQTACTKMTYIGPCKHTTRLVTINVQSGTVAPPFVCAESGKTVTFQVKPNSKADEVAVAVLPKDKNDTWLVGINSPDPLKFEITVPADEDEDSHHDYYVVTSNGTCYDPRIHVDP